MTGINRFAYEISKKLITLVDCEFVVPKNSVRRDVYDVSGFKITEYGRLKSHLWEQISLWKYSLKHNKSILLNLSGLGPILYQNKITSIHDLSFLHNPKWFSKSYYYFYRWLTPWIIKTSLIILTVSNFSKKEIIKYFEVPESKIRIIYNAVNKSNHIPHVSKTSEDFVLVVGSLDPRKNFKILIEAFKSKQLQNIKLHVVGEKNRVFGNSEINTDSFHNICFLGRISDDELKKEYLNARLFILPSLYEGFGIPPLEALSFGCPVLLSDIPVFREIYGNTVSYFNPTDINNLIDKISTLFNASVEINQHEIAALFNKYSWNKSALQIVTIVGELYEKSYHLS